MPALTASKSHTSSMPSTPIEPAKRTFTGANLNPNAKVSNSAGQKIKNFFRINSKNEATSANTSEKGSFHSDTQPDINYKTSSTQSAKASARSSRFIPHLGRSRTNTVASEGHPLDDALSPTATANPYFQHQGPPALRHHDAGSIPPSPPDTPRGSKKIAPQGEGKETLSASGKEELARKLRRVASAPNAQGLFSKGKKNNSDSRPTTADEDALAPPKPNGMGAHSNASAMSLGGSALIDDNSLTVPDLPGDMSPGKIRNNIAFRRTYSSNSIKVRNVEVGPSSFDKIKLIGKGDVGKVYLVREKKSSRLYAMKGERQMMIPTPGSQPRRVKLTRV
jgi:protein-serine/threonine kinase